MAKKVNMKPTLDVMSDVFDVRFAQAEDNMVPSWPWMDDQKAPIVPDSPGERTYENYKKAAAFLLYKMEVHRGELSEATREVVHG